MNLDLRESIIKHIMSNFGIIPSAFINLNKTKSLIHKDLLLNETVSFNDDNGVTTSNPVWACQISIEGKPMKVLLANCSQDSSLLEYALIVSMKDSPCYGVYFINDPNSHDSLIGCSLDNKEWMECHTYLQATFLAGMEQIKEAGLSWSKCTEYKDQYTSLLTFIKFHNRVYEAKYL